MRLRRDRSADLPRPVLIICRCGALIVASSKEHVERAKQHHSDNDRCDRETFNGWVIHDWQLRVRPAND